MATAITFQPIQLVPVHAYTKQVLEDRPSLTVASQGAIVFLGDNDSTGIVDPGLSHKVIKVYGKRLKIFAFLLPDGRGNAKLNGDPIPKGGRREIRLQDILTLSSDNEEEEEEYMYRVVLADASALPAPEPTKPAAAAAVAVPSISKDVAEETMCSICMEIMVEPRTVVPCGHSACKSCLASQSECAECRGPIQSQITCRSLQNLIEKMADAEGAQIFDKEDLDSYRNRTKGSSAAPGSARKRRRGRETRTAANGSSWVQAVEAQQVFLDLTD